MTCRPMVRAFAGVAAAVMFGTAHAEPVTVDNCGTPLTFDTAPERVVVHDINMSDMAFALDLQDRMVGVSGISGWYKTTPEFDERRDRSRSWHRSTRPSRTWSRPRRTCSLPAGTTACAPAAT